MKLRIQDNSIRFRITVKELEALVGEGRIERACAFPGSPSLRYVVSRDDKAPKSYVFHGPCLIELRLCADDMAVLSDPESEGAYIRREWEDADGEHQRFMAFIEKDRPASTCKKIESWIYEGHNGQENILTPIPAKRR
jgi:hypothetical protein